LPSEDRGYYKMADSEHPRRVKSFLGVAKYYRKFIPAYSQRSAALRQLISKNKHFHWGLEQEKSFQDLKSALVSPPILQYPDSNREFYLEIDASINGLSYVLGQRDHLGRKFVISYGGRGLRPCEKVWSVSDQECLALLTGIREYHVYLAGRLFSVYTDHLSLKYLQSLKVSSNRRLTRWALALQPYKFEIYYKKGSKLTAADGISRRPFPEPLVEEDDELKEDSFIASVHTDIFDLNVDNTTTPKKNRKPWTSITIDYENDDLGASTEEVVTTINDPLNVADGYNVQQLQRQNPDFIPIFHYLEQGILPNDDKAARKLVFEVEHFVIKDGILYHIFHPRTKRLHEVKPVIQQLCVPNVLREELLRAYHDNNAHVGRERLYDTLKQKHYFPYMYTTVIEYVSSCHICQTTKTSPHMKKAPLKPLEIPPAFYRLHLDFVGPLPKSSEGFRHIFCHCRQHYNIGGSIHDQNNKCRRSSTYPIQGNNFQIWGHAPNFDTSRFFIQE